MSLNTDILTAIRNDNWVSLRTILSQQVDGDDGVVDADMDNHIDWAFYSVPTAYINLTSIPEHVKERFIQAFRLLWARLSHVGRQKYFEKENNDEESPLHEAVQQGHLFIVRWFIQECNFNVNQYFNYSTALYYAVEKLHRPEDMIRFLVKEAGADVNRGGAYGPLFSAVLKDYAGIVRFLLEHGANPNLNRGRVDDEERNGNHSSHRHHIHTHTDWEINRIVGPDLYLYYRARRNTDWAIRNGNSEILSMLLQHGAFVGHDGTTEETSLNDLLCNQQKSYDVKHSISRILVEHARSDTDTALFIKISLEKVIRDTSNFSADDLEILLNAGAQTSVGDLCVAIRSMNEPATRMLVQHGVDPIVENDDELYAVNSPFLLAARQENTCIFEYFLELWDERFASSSRGRGKNGAGDYPIHVVCCDPHVSLQAIKLLVNRDADALATVDGEQGLLPFHFAAMWDANLDVVVYLLQNCPDALPHHHHHAGNAVSLLVINGSNDSKTTLDTNIDHVETSGGQVKKKAKTLIVHPNKKAKKR